MATIDKRGDLQWRVQIRRKGYPVVRKTFSSRAEAEAWARMVEGEMDRGIFVSRTEAESTTLAEALDRYEREVTSHQKGAVQYASLIRIWKRTPLAARFISTIQGSDLAKYRDERLKLVSPKTVSHELGLLSRLFHTAIKDWGMGGLVNPVSQIRKPKLPRGRDRRLLPEEERALLEACASYGGDIAGIVRFALETGMRRSEIAGMTWDRVDLKKRTVTLPETKNGEKRIVPLSTEAVRILSGLPRRLDASVWGMEADSITQAFLRALSRARKAYEKECEKKGERPDPSFLTKLTFHDLRH
ncbi:MAG: tyrosine-type recombinase/integrase, partial [Leptospirillia bacterium]